MGLRIVVGAASIFLPGSGAAEPNEYDAAPQQRFPHFYKLCAYDKCWGPHLCLCAMPKLPNELKLKQMYAGSFPLLFKIEFVVNVN
jgi:hypothetical protein